MLKFKYRNDFIRGDLIYFDNKACLIFDGHKLMEIKSKFGIYLPNKFRVIENNIPLDYWIYFPCTDIIWFDQSKVQEQ